MGHLVLERKKKKILIGNEYKMKTLYLCRCKWGAHSTTYCYLFSNPKKGLTTVAMQATYPENPYELQHGVIVDEIAEDGLVYLSMA